MTLVKTRAFGKTVCIALLCLCLIQSAKAQMVGLDAYIQGTSLEVGINGAGGFEGVDQSTSPAPTGYHARDAFSPFGFIANPLVDGWVMYDGDFYTPGAPENGWGFEIGAIGGARGDNNYILTGGGFGGTPDISGSITSFTHVGDCYNLDWDGDDTIGTNLHFKINYFLQQNDLFYTTTVSITNNTAATIDSIYYYRSLDPDNNVSIGTGGVMCVDGSQFNTQNTIVCQAGVPGSTNVACVSATSLDPVSQPQSYLGLAGIGPNFRVTYGGFSNRDASDIWNNTTTGTGGFPYSPVPLVQTPGSTYCYDDAISLSYLMLNLAPGATQTFKFAVILDNTAATNIMTVSFPGSRPFAICDTSRVDTIVNCGLPVPLDILGSTVGSYTWTWTPAYGLSTTAGPSTIATPTVTTTYTATGVPSSPCVAAVPVSVHFVMKVVPDNLADPVIVPIPNICITTPAFSLAVDSSGGIWSGHGITNVNTGMYDPSVAGVGTDTVIYAIGVGPCQRADTIAIPVIGLQSSTITQPLAICIDTSAITPIRLEAFAPGGVWSGPGITDSILGVFDPNVTGTGNFTVSYKISSTCLFTQDTVIITVDSVFNPTITDHPFICKNEPVFNFTAAHTGGTWSGAGITNSVLGTFNPVTAGVGPHIITYRFADPCGSVDTTTITVLPIPDPTITDVTFKCINSGAFTMTAADAGGVWSGTGITDTLTGTFDPAIAGAGVHNVVYTIPGRCPATDSSPVTVIALPVLSIVTDITEGCPPTTVTFTGITDQPGGDYSWEMGDGSTIHDTSSLASPIYSYAYPGSYSVSFTYTNTTGCVNTVTVTNLVTVHPQPVALMAITPKPADILAPTVNFIDQSIGSVTAWLWDFGPFGTSILQNPSVVYNDTGNYPVQLIVTSVYGCLDTLIDTARVAPVYLFYAPNAFTPNGDGNNDVFRVFGNEISSDGFEMDIFDRWGNKIFKTNNPYEGWNGATNNVGKTSERDVYVYKVVLKDHIGNSHQYMGQVTLVK